jgi:hypothetical protein
MSINKTLTVIALIYAACASIILAQLNLDDLKERLLAQAQNISPNEYAFTRTIRTEQTSNGKTEHKVMVEEFDPTKPAEARWTLESVDGAPPAADELKEFRKESAKRPVPGYSRLAGYFGTTATTSTDSRKRTVFHFAALPKDTVKVMGTDVSANATVEASVAEANGASFVEQIHITLKPMRLKLLMKLEKYEATAHYRIGPEGKPLLMEQTSDMQGSGMGQQGGAHTAVTYSDYKTVGKQR